MILKTPLYLPFIFFLFISNPLVIPNDQNSNFQDDYFDFQDVFCNDWFLIELGKNLVTNPDADKDLLNILCLNRKINSRATTVFKNYFLNFELQKQVQTLANAKQFDHVEQLFETQKLALNPNFNITLENKNQIPKESFPTFTFENSEEGQEEEEQTNENQSSQFPFVTFALRSKSHSLVKSLLLHPRMNFARLSKPRLFEVCFFNFPFNFLKFQLIISFIFPNFRLFDG